VTEPAVVIGGGPAGLMAADVLAQAGKAVIIFDQASSLARKFLLAGRGGLNLTHTDPPERFLARYGAGTDALRNAIETFPPQALREWSEALGEPTFVGSSGRVFPKGFKSSPLLRAWLRRLASLGVTVRPRGRFVGFNEIRHPVFEGPDGRFAPPASVVILACGGASWPRLGSDGGWVSVLREAGVDVADLRPANCGFLIDWTEPFRQRFAGAPLKSIALAFGDMRLRGEALITQAGMEGGAVYALSSALRGAIDAGQETALTIDLKPDVALDDLARRLGRPREGQSSSTFLRKATGLPPVAIALIREGGTLPTEAAELAARIKGLRVRLTGVASIARAISSAGGVKWSELDESFMLRRLPGVFAAGEMIDWEAPTGGYLLQACFSTGAAAARGALKWLER
jgi:uncharacterized flavoprotein (TIGR03862 family)